ncbi:cation-translocating P-type ATPase [Nocardioides panacihumi]|uniref:Cation-translocating P-type ATPase n=1 Tax=Nocardioides panacihumi TaxID=400774 RepID=A0ABP5D6C3_9ACTN
MTTRDEAVGREHGLSSAEAAELLGVEGPNEVAPTRPRTLPTRIGLQLVDPMILLLCGAFVVVCLLGDVSDAIIIAAVVVLNTTLGVVQELRAERAIAALDEMAAPLARVRRDGVVVELPARELVAHDVVRLEAGDVVPADLELVEAVSLQVDEASMTGESLPVERGVGEEVQSGTVVTGGRGFGVVVRTGASSGLGRIATLVATTRVRRTPLQRRLTRLSRQLIVAVGVLAGVVLASAVIRGEPFADSLILAVSLAVAAIPESLPAVVSVALALGAFRMARQSALVRWLPAVETLGSVSLLASDKTGTLTEGRMTVRELWVPGGRVEVPSGADQRWRTDADEQVRRLLRDVVLCNDARLVPGADGWTGIGDPMEGALLVAAASYDATLLDSATALPRLGETPFDSIRQWMATVHRSPDGDLRVVKGAPEVVLDTARPGQATRAAAAEASRMAAGGCRVLAVADSVGGAGELEVVGLVGLVDPPRDDAADVVTACRDAGIRTILVTGDHPATARSIAEQVGITDAEGVVVDGDAVARGEHAERVASIDVYARIKPEQKVEIVDAWQRGGHVVAMTGDGVNDAPALRRADIGVAMGRRGTEVARQAADLVLADDNLRTVVVAVAEGRRIYANIRKFLRYALSGGLAEVLVILVAPFLGMPIPLLPGQILWINMLTHGLPGVAFGAEPLDRRLMRKPSPPPEESVLGDGLGRSVASGGALIAAVSLVGGLLALGQGWPVTTAIFTTLGFAQLGVALALRAPRRGTGVLERGLEGAILTSAVLQVAAVVASPLRDLLELEPMGGVAWAVTLVLAAVPGLAVAVGVRREGPGHSVRSS